MFGIGFRQVLAFFVSVFLYLVYYYRFRWGCSVYRFNFDSVKPDGSDYVQGLGWIDKYNMLFSKNSDNKFEFLYGGNIPYDYRKMAYAKLKGLRYDNPKNVDLSHSKNTYVSDFDKVYEKEVSLEKRKMRQYALLYDFIKSYPYLLMGENKSEIDTKQDNGELKLLNLSSVTDKIILKGGKEFSEQFYGFEFFDANYFSEYEYLLFNELFSGRLDRDEYGEWIYRFGRCENDFVSSKAGLEVLSEYTQKQDDYVLLQDLKILFCDYYKMVLLVRLDTRYAGFEIVAVHKYQFSMVYNTAKQMLTSFSPTYGGWLGKSFINDKVDGKLDLMGQIRIKRYKTLRSNAGQDKG